MWKQRQSDHCALQLSHCEFNILPTDAGHWRRGESRGNGHCRRGAGHAGTISDAGHWRRGAVIGTKLAGLWQLGERNRSGCSSRTFSIATEEKSVRSGASQAKGEGGRVEKVTTAAGVRARTRRWGRGGRPPAVLGTCRPLATPMSKRVSEAGGYDKQGPPEAMDYATSR